MGGALMPPNPQRKTQHKRMSPNMAACTSRDLKTSLNERLSDGWYAKRRQLRQFKPSQA